jgi:N utilization substance protein B
VEENMSRREQREQIFKILFGVEFHSADELEEQIGLYMEDLGDIRKKDADYMTGKVRSIVEHMDEIDGMINQASKNWKTTRMAKAELSILRLAAYEIKYEDDIPVSVSINEAVELAKLYGSDHGPAFVNGILSGMV